MVAGQREHKEDILEDKSILECCVMYWQKCEHCLAQAECFLDLDSSFFLSTVAKQSSKSKVIFLTLKAGVWESGPSCADTTPVILKCTALLQEYDPERARASHTHTHDYYDYFPWQPHICPE